MSEPQVPTENYGEFKMQMFKRNARQILGSGQQHESAFLEDLFYN